MNFGNSCHWPGCKCSLDGLKQPVKNKETKSLLKRDWGCNIFLVVTDWELEDGVCNLKSLFDN